jgi:hypothetical protein
MVRGLALEAAWVRRKSIGLQSVYFGAILWLFSFVAFAYFSAPGLTFHDSGEFNLALHAGGVPHPPGAPTWALLNTLLKLIMPGIEAARVGNLCSAFWGASTIGLAGAFVYRHFADQPAKIRLLAGTLCGLILAGTGAFLEQSFITEQYTLLTSILMIILLQTQSQNSHPKLYRFFTLGTLWGLAIGNHPSQICLGLFCLYQVIIYRKQFSWLKSGGLGLVGLTCGLSVFAYLPLSMLANPEFSYGRPLGWEQLKWVILREQWQSRPFGEAPVGMVAEWIKSYNLIGEMGWLGLSLGITGVVFGFRRAAKPVVWLLLLVLPYTLMMLIGHLKQKNIDHLYISFYGVRDWHLPVYLSMAILGAMAPVWLANIRDKVQDKHRVACLVVCALTALGVCIPRISAESYRENGSASVFARQVLQPLEPNSFVASGNDDTIFTIAYESTVNNVRPDVKVVFGLPQSLRMQGDLAPGTTWSSVHRVTYLNSVLNDPTKNPFRNPRISPERLGTMRLYGDFGIELGTDVAKWVLPAGYVFEFCDRKVTDADVKVREARLRANYPHL